MDFMTRVRQTVEFFQKAAQDFAQSELGVALKCYIDSLPKNPIPEFLKQEELVFILGAGVSLDYSVPIWSDLVKEVCYRRMQVEWRHHQYPDLLRGLIGARFTKDIGHNSLIQARFATRDGDSATVRGWVKNSLYAAFTQPTSTTCLKALAEFAAESKVKLTFLTYNYDDVLEQELSKNGVRFSSVWNAGGWEESKGSSEISVIHLHGFIPMEGDVPEDQTLVLSEHEYNQLLSDPGDWRNLCQLQAFRGSFLMLGISLSDPNMRRLLDVAKSDLTEGLHRIIVRKRRGFDTSHRDPEIDKLYNALHDGIDSETGIADIPEELRVPLYQLWCDISKPLQENDDLSFGLQTWEVSDFKSLPDLIIGPENLRKLRKEMEAMRYKHRT